MKVKRLDGQPLRHINIGQILLLLPHRAPFIFIDALEVYGEMCGVGIKNVTIGEPFFTGHFPENPVMPGVLIVEAMAQTAGVLVVESLGYDSAPQVLFLGVDRARFRHPVVPGDRLELHAIAKQNRGGVWSYEAYAFVGQKLVAEASYKAAIIRNDIKKHKTLA